MDPVYSNKIAAEIHKYCLKFHGTPATYVQDPVRFRQNIETCFVNVLDQHKEVMKGV